MNWLIFSRLKSIKRVSFKKFDNQITQSKYIYLFIYLFMDNQYSNQIFIQNLSFRVKELEIRSFFEQCGKVTNVNIIKNDKTGEPKGFGIVTFEKPQYVEYALKNLNNQNFAGRKIRIERVSSQKMYEMTNRRLEIEAKERNAKLEEERRQKLKEEKKKKIEEEQNRKSKRNHRHYPSSQYSSSNDLSENSSSSKNNSKNSTSQNQKKKIMIKHKLLNPILMIKISHKLINNIISQINHAHLNSILMIIINHELLQVQDLKELYLQKI